MTNHHSADEKPCIGSKEFIHFPVINKKNIIARIDTGAKTSAIHCERVWVQRINNKKVLCANLLKKTKKITQFSHFSLKKIRSSNGEVQIRYIVHLDVLFGNDSFEAEFTLTNRDNMNHSVLLGRRFLRDRYVVDVSDRFLYSEKI